MQEYCSERQHRIYDIYQNARKLHSYAVLYQGLHIPHIRRKKERKKERKKVHATRVYSELINAEVFTQYIIMI